MFLLIDISISPLLSLYNQCRKKIKEKKKDLESQELEGAGQKHHLLLVQATLCPSPTRSSVSETSLPYQRPNTPDPRLPSLPPNKGADPVGRPGEAGKVSPPNAEVGAREPPLPSVGVTVHVSTTQVAAATPHARGWTLPASPGRGAPRWTPPRSPGTGSH